MPPARILPMFLDRAKIWVRAGDGGDGAADLPPPGPFPPRGPPRRPPAPARRGPLAPGGGPDGGDGGRGGSVYMRVDPGQTTLADFRFKHHFKAPAGGRGSGSKRHGNAGGDLELAVPPGTGVIDETSGDLLADRVPTGQRVMIARGGRGGLGNVHFATATHRTPLHAQKGEPAEERWIRLELRLIADVGLVGLPNAGKSTLLAALTAATPKIAPYPFTTLEPNLGILDLEAIDPTDPRRPTIADVPGLIEGASSGAGLGHAFLRHVERTRVLVHVVDIAARDPEADHAIIRDELRLHDPRLLEKPFLVVANKTDLTDAADNLKAFLAARRSEGFAVEREGEAFRVRGKRIERLAAQTDFGNDESAERFQRDLVRWGIERERRRAGVEPGDMVRIGAVELEWGAEPWA